MQVAFLVIAHNAPKQLQRLLARLAHPDHHVFVHIDAKSQIEDFAASLALPHVITSRIRLPVYWGSFRACQATLELIKQALAREPRIERFVLLSGVDHPLDTAANINRFFADNRDVEFIELDPMPSESKALSRLEHLYVSGAHPPWIRGLAKLRRALRLGPIKRDYRKGLKGLAPIGGAQWWALTREAASYIDRFADENPDFVRFHDGVLIPDESFFSTILGNSDFASRVTDCVTYTDWSAGGSHPALIGKRHLEFFKAVSGPCARAEGLRPLLFARKFTDEDAAVCAEIDALVDGRGA